MWKEGTIGVPGDGGKYTAIHYWVKYYEKPSKTYGVEGGCISKLMLKQDGKIVYNYDRGLDIEPQTKEAKQVLEVLMLEYN